MLILQPISWVRLFFFHKFGLILLKTQKCLLFKNNNFYQFYFLHNKNWSLPALLWPLIDDYVNGILERKWCCINLFRLVETLRFKEQSSITVISFAMFWNLNDKNAKWATNTVRRCVTLLPMLQPSQLATIFKLPVAQVVAHQHSSPAPFKAPYLPRIKVQGS